MYHTFQLPSPINLYISRQPQLRADSYGAASRMFVEILCGVYAEGRQLKVTTAGVGVGLLEMLQSFISDINCDNDSLN